MKKFIWPVLSFCFLMFAFSANARMPIYEKCEIKAEKDGLVYSNIFSVVIDLDFAYSNDLNKVMQGLYSKHLKVIQWDKRSENELRAFVTFPTDLPSKATKQALENLAGIDGVSTLCVATSIKF